MELKHGLISAADHVQEPPELWFTRVESKWAERAPRLQKQPDGSEAWTIDGQTVPLTGASSVGALMDDRTVEPRTWAEMPRAAYVPSARLDVMDRDGVDYSVLLPSVAGVAGENLNRIEDADLELACVRAYNDWLAQEWTGHSPRFVPQCLIPLSSIEAAIAEARRAVGRGHRGVIFPSIPMEIRDLPHLNEPDWDPFWAAVAEMNVPLVMPAGAPGPIQIPPDPRLSPRVADAFRAITRAASHVPVMVNFLLSRILLRHPTLRVVFAESALGWVAYLLEYTDHQFREDRVDTEGYELFPSGMFHRQGFVTGWYDRGGVRTRDIIGVDNIMWSTMFPQTTSTYPDTKQFVTRGLEGVPQDERDKLLWSNAAQLYQLQ
jgi:predicted TIM-barrel fold metal-dependent hydrolase